MKKRLAYKHTKKTAPENFGVNILRKNFVPPEWRKNLKACLCSYLLASNLTSLALFVEVRRRKGLHASLFFDVKFLNFGKQNISNLQIICVLKNFEFQNIKIKIAQGEWMSMTSIWKI